MYNGNKQYEEKDLSFLSHKLIFNNIRAETETLFFKITSLKYQYILNKKLF